MSAKTHGEHAFTECTCGGALQYQTRADVLCSDCGGEFHHEIRAPARHLLWTFDDDYRLDEISEEVHALVPQKMASVPDSSDRKEERRD